MTSRTPDLTLVLAGTGKTGRRVAQRLRDRGLAVRVGSRSAQPAFDWERPDTWAAAIEGADAVYVSYVPDIAMPGAPETVAAFTRQAVAAGVGRVVLLSGRGEAEAQRAEDAVWAIAPHATVLRASWFAQNFSEHFLLDGVLAGELALPVDGVGEPFVDVDDIADVAVAVLTDDEHAGRLYELTGPRLLTFAQAMGEIGAATGRDLRFTSIGLDPFCAGLVEQGVPAEEVGALRYLFSEVLDGRNASTADGVQRALGRPARDFTDFARTAAAAGAWG